MLEVTQRGPANRFLRFWLFLTRRGVIFGARGSARRDGSDRLEARDRFLDDAFMTHPAH